MDSGLRTIYSLDLESSEEDRKAQELKHCHDKNKNEGISQTEKDILST